MPNKPVSRSNEKPVRTVPAPPVSRPGAQDDNRVPGPRPAPAGRPGGATPPARPAAASTASGPARPTSAPSAPSRTSDRPAQQGSNTNAPHSSSGGRPGGQRTGGGFSGGGSRGGRPGGGARGGRPQGAHGRSSGGTRPPDAGEAPRPVRPERPDPLAVTELTVPAQITVRELAEKMRRSPIEVIKALMNYGIMVPITHTIDFDTAVIVGEDLGITVKPEEQPEVAEETKTPEEGPRTLRQKIMADEDPNTLVVRPPIVTVLGHVDHGKTTLLDAIRETRVVDGEAGGITQHIGAYQVERNGRLITFLDTPGHEAFTAMRARGAQLTDLAILVVAADDGVMPQTKEAIAHVRAAQVPILVALNKIDKPNANPDRVKQELADNGLLVEEYGGDVLCVPVSAKMRRGIDDLLESILLLADVDPIKANPNGKCLGTVVESQLDKSRGPTATLLVQNGTLRVGDSLVLGDIYGKARAMFDDKGRAITEAPPATPVVLLGLAEVPVAGDTFEVMADDRTARSVAAERAEKRKAALATPTRPVLALENIFAQVEAGQVKDLNVILKADVQGSLEPIVNSLEKLSSDKVRVKILHQGAGNVTESDVMLAIASGGIILGFSVNTDPTVQRMADGEGIDIRNYNIIYKLIEDVEKALKGMLEPVFKEVITGHAEIRQVFRVTRVGKVAGSYVTDGEIARSALVRVRRNGAVIQEDRVSGLKRFTEDVSEVRAGFECGINLANFTDLEVGDVIEAYKKERVS
jgi:translation initiation factor IF-2